MNKIKKIVILNLMMKTLMILMMRLSMIRYFMISKTNLCNNKININNQMLQIKHKTKIFMFRMMIYLKMKLKILIKTKL